MNRTSNINSEPPVPSPQPPVPLKSRTIACIALSLALAGPAANCAQSQCNIDPVTGRRVCVLAPGLPTGERAPALDSRHLNLESPSLPALDTRPSTVDHSAHCRIHVADGTAGSGTLIEVTGDTALVLTCAHLFDSSAECIIVAFPNNTRFAAKLVDRDRAHDLAALRIRAPQVAPIQINDTNPSGALVACGYGPSGQFRSTSGRLVGHATAVGASFPSLTMSGAVRPGDSGGAVLNTAGQLVGVVWGQQGGLTYATCGRPLRNFLDRIRRQPPAPPGVESPKSKPPSGTRLLALESRVTAVEHRINTLDVNKQPKGDYALHSDLANYLRAQDAPQIDPRQFAKRTELESQIKSVSSRFESVHSRIESVRRRAAEIANAKAGLFQGLSLGKLLAGALGLSGPLAIAVIVAGGVGGKRIKSRVKSEESRARNTPALDSRLSALDSAPIVVDSPIPPQRTTHETHYVPIERDSFAKAHQWASEHVARKYPGATEILQALESLIKQHMSAH